jgi:glycosyltransferase involved in cell wall biosynthesis
VKSLHVCYISQEYPPETGWGGVGAYTHEMAHALAGAGNRVTVITQAVKARSVATESGVEVHRISPRPSWDKVPFFWRLNRVWPGFAWSAMLRVRQINRRHPIDIIEAAEVRADAFFVSLLPRRPKLVTRLHTAQVFVDHFNNVPSERVRPWNYWFEKKAIKRADLVTAPSKAVLNLTRKWFPLDAQKTLVIPNPIDQYNFLPSVSESRNVVLYVGRLERNKGAESMMRALPILLERFPSIEFWFVGSDSLDRDGQSWRSKILESIDPVHRSKLRFQEVSRKELACLYPEAAVCVLPSKWENAPYAVLEAMACGTPVVACDSGGAPELIEHDVSGFLVPVDDFNALAARISELITQPALRRVMGQNARRRIEQSFSLERVLPKMLAAYDHAMAND